jgi:hypothetical protein
VTDLPDSAWQPQLERDPGRSYKWGLNGQTGDLAVWEVHGPGDGLPSHEDHLGDRWGRSPSLAQDRLGIAHVDQHQVELAAYFANTVPEPVLNWARRTFPTRIIRA